MNKVSKEKTVEFVKNISEATNRELLDFILNIVSGAIGMALPFVGNVFLNYKNIKTDMEELEKKIEKLNVEQKKAVRSEIEKICIAQTQRNLDNQNAEIYTVDGLEIVLRMDEEELEGANAALLELLQDGNSSISAMLDTLFIVDNRIVMNLLEPIKRKEIDDLIEEIDGLISEVCDSLWGRSLIKKIYFY